MKGIGIKLKYILTGVVLFSQVAFAASIIMNNGFIKTAISDDGTLGIGGTSKPGLQYDANGGGDDFLDTSDYLTPGTPHELFSVKYGSIIKTNKNELFTSPQMPTIITGSSAEVQAISNVDGILEVLHVYSLPLGEKTLEVFVSITNISDSDVLDVKYLRSIDPDVDSNGLPGSTTNTNNFRGNDTYSENDIVYAEGPVTSKTMALFSIDPTLHNTSVSGWTVDPDVALSGINVGHGDKTIDLGFSLSNLSPGQTKTFKFFYVLGDNISDVKTFIYSAPVQNINTGSSLLEGATDIITSTELDFDDDSSPDTDITYTVTILPINGILKLNGSDNIALNSTFTQDDINNNRISYVHNHSNTISDSFNFKVSDADGSENIGNTFSFGITPIDDDAPIIVNNTGIILDEGATVSISDTNLSATDTEADDATLSFTITTAQVNGRVENSDAAGTAITTFTQQDLLDGKIQYVHDGSDTTSDSFEFNVSDGSNNLTNQTFSITITPVDDTAPLAPSAPDLTNASDTGDSSTDNLTNNTTSAFTGTAEAGSTVKLYAGAVLVGTTTATGGNWSITSSVLANGAHSITATATDASGNTSPASSALSVTIDTGVPVLAEVTAVATPTSDTTPDYTFSTTETGDLNVSGSCGSTGKGSVTAGEHTITLTHPDNSSPLSDGTHTNCTLMVTDAAGNDSAPLNVNNFMVDTTVPSGYSIAFNDSEINMTETATSTFTFSGAEEGATYSYTVTSNRGGTPVTGSGTVTAVGQNITLADLSNLFDGQLTLSVSLTDKAGNIGSIATTSTVLNAVAEGITVIVIDANTSEETTDNNATFNVTLHSQPTHDVNITLLNSDITEGEISKPGIKKLTFTVANWNISQTVTVTGINDDIDDGNISYTIDLNASSSDSEYNGKTAQAELTNLDDDTAGISVSTPDINITTENGGSTGFTLVLTSEPIEDVNLTLSSSDTTEGTVSPTLMTFTTSDWNVSQTVTVTGVDDNEVDGDILYSISMVSSSLDSNYQGLNKTENFTNVDTDSDGDGVVEDGDNCPITSNPDQEDMDGDKIGDACDSDIDGDGVDNSQDEFPYDETEWDDTDRDGIGDNTDPFNTLQESDSNTTIVGDTSISFDSSLEVTVTEVIDHEDTNNSYAEVVHTSNEVPGCAPGDYEGYIRVMVNRSMFTGYRAATDCPIDDDPTLKDTLPFKTGTQASIHETSDEEKSEHGDSGVVIIIDEAILDTEMRF